MNTNNKLNKANSYRLSQELLRNKALKNGVNLVAPETIFLSKDTFFGRTLQWILMLLSVQMLKLETILTSNLSVI